MKFSVFSKAFYRAEACNKESDSWYRQAVQNLVGCVALVLNLFRAAAIEWALIQFELARQRVYQSS